MERARGHYVMINSNKLKASSSILQSRHRHCSQPSSLHELLPKFSIDRGFVRSKELFRLSSSSSCFLRRKSMSTSGFGGRIDPARNVSRQPQQKWMSRCTEEESAYGGGIFMSIVSCFARTGRDSTVSTLVSTAPPASLTRP